MLNISTVMLPNDLCLVLWRRKEKEEEPYSRKIQLSTSATISKRDVQL
jgi:hypothetical protein